MNMENYKYATEAFLKGGLPRGDLAWQLREVIKQTPTKYNDIKTYLTELRHANKLSLEDYSMLQARIDDFTSNIPTQPPFQPSSGNSANTSSSGSQSSDSPINQSDWQNPSQWEDSEKAVPKEGVVIRDNYRLEEIVGTGGMGVVWKAVNLIQEAGEVGNPHVAIKFLSPDFKQHPDALKVLVREFSRYKKLSHKNILQAYELNRTGSSVFIVMEFLNGIPLKQFIIDHSDGIAIEEAEPIIRGMANALSHAHNEGIIHLDFKPTNVFYEPEQKILKVIDFGIARGISDGEKTILIHERLGGVTEAYASCERLSGKEPDKRDDIYALACVTYELLSGKHPFDRKKATKAEEEKLSPKPIKGLKPEQNQALLHGLAFTREERTPDAEQFLAEIFPEKKKYSLGLVIGGGIIVLLLAGVTAFFALKIPLEPDPPAAKCQQYLEAGHSTGKWDSALTCYQEVLDVNPKNHEVLIALREIEVAQLLGQCKQYLEAGRPTGELEAARACYQEIQKIDPENSDVLADLKEINQLGLAHKNDDSPKLEPHEIKLQECKQHLEAGRLTMGNEGTALACYKEVLNLKSSNAAALAGLMKIKVRYVRGRDTASKYEQSKMVQRLAQSLVLVEKELGKEVDVLLKKCRAHFGAGKKESALTCYQDVLKLDADNDFALDGIKAIIGTEVNVSLQTCQKHFEANRLSSGIGGNALDCYKKILRQDPDNDDAQKGLKAIEKRYEEWANKALRKKQFAKVKGYLVSLEKVDPHSSILADLRRRLKKALK